MNPYGPPFAPFGGPPRPIGAPPMVTPMAPPIRFPGMPPPMGMPGMPTSNVIAAPPMSYRVPMMPFPNGPSFGRVPDQVTTVYVGKIPPAVDDDFVRKLLEKCGKVAQWRRVNDPVTGKLKGFGFCDYYNADGALRALRLLLGLKVGESELLLRVDEKTQKYLDEYEARLKSGLFKKDSLLDPDIKEDDVTKEEILQIVARRFGNKDANKESSSTSPTRASNPPSTTGPTTPPPPSTVPPSTTTPPRSDTQPNGTASDKESKKEGVSAPSEGNAESDGKNSRQAERERELARRKEKEENEYRDAVRSWEKREADVARDRERDKERTSYSSSSVNRAALDAEYDYETERKKHSREYNRRKREREREKQDDEMERMNEYNESRTPPPLPPLPKEEKDESPTAPFPISPPYAPNMNDSEASTVESISDKGKVVLGLSVEKKKVVAASVPFDEEDGQGNANQAKKKRKLPLLDAPLHEENSRQGKLEQVKSLIEQIPTEKDKIFDYPMDWQVIDQFSIVENKMRIWITKQIGELLGEEEITMIDFIVARVKSHNPPKSILEQIYFVLDEEAESFVIKMWRRLIFEMLSAKSPSNPT